MLIVVKYVFLKNTYSNTHTYFFSEWHVFLCHVFSRIFMGTSGSSALSPPQAKNFGFTARKTPRCNLAIEFSF